jgi:hypothetical protein
MSSNEIIILIIGVIIIVAFWPEAGSIRRRAAEPMHHPGLLTYLVVVMLCVKQPWNFLLIFIGIVWARRLGTTASLFRACSRCLNPSKWINGLGRNGADDLLKALRQFLSFLNRRAVKD